MNQGTLLVIGAAGDVGQGIVAGALAAGRRVVAAGRDSTKLDGLAAQHGGSALASVTGDLGSEAGALALWASANQALGPVEDVVVSVNAQARMQELGAWSAEELSAALDANVLTHFNAATTFLPLMPETGMLIGIGGGTADFIFPKMAHVSMAQAALRMLYRGLAKERQSGAQLRELMIISMVAGHSNREAAQPDWVTDREVGQHVCAILESPDAFAGPILKLKSREQVGKPEER
ncbi:MAG: SDR family NAD(P)-dependent oxidoreductase [Novosphingobium sp.]|nr:SDR family NAD(P)-dependent oxidoreductase [Novosphingobium sp.]